MKIAIVYPYFNNRGGIERYIWELSKVLRHEHDITLVASSWDKGCEKVYNFLKIPILSRPWFLSSVIFSIFSYRKLKKFNFDIVYVQGASCLKQDIVTAQSCHKAWFMRSLRETKKWSRSWWLKLFNPLHYLTISVGSIQYRKGNYRKVIAISKVIKDELNRYYSIPESDIEVIYSGVNCTEFHPSNRRLYFNEIRERHNIRNDEILLLFVANEFKRKGLEYLLKAVSLLNDIPLRLLVVGKDKTEEYVKLSENLGISEKIIFVGTSCEMSKYYAASDIFIFPTSYEPFGLVITEAMASGLPVIVSKLAGAAELIRDGESGLLINDCRNSDEIASLILRLLDPDVRMKIGMMARRKAEEYTWDKVGFQTIEIFKNVLGSRRF